MEILAKYGISTIQWPTKWHHRFAENENKEELWWVNYLHKGLYWNLFYWIVNGTTSVANWMKLWQNKNIYFRYHIPNSYTDSLYQYKSTRCREKWKPLRYLPTHIRRYRLTIWKPFITSGLLTWLGQYLPKAISTVDGCNGCLFYLNFYFKENDWKRYTISWRYSQSAPSIQLVFHLPENIV